MPENLRQLFTPVGSSELDALFEELSGLTGKAIERPEEKPLFLQAAERRAAARGMSAIELLNDEAARLKGSTYPTPECLTPDEVQQLSDSRAPSTLQQEHLATCDPCRRLLEAVHPSSERIQALLHEINEMSLARRVADGITQVHGHASAAASGKKAAV